jgi:hypothetical protein
MNVPTANSCPLSSLARHPLYALVGHGGVEKARLTGMRGPQGSGDNAPPSVRGIRARCEAIQRVMLPIYSPAIHRHLAHHSDIRPFVYGLSSK